MFVMITETQLAEMVNRKILLILGPDTNKPFSYYNWTEFLQAHFRKSLVIITSVFAILLLVVYLYENLPMTKKWS